MGYDTVLIAIFVAAPLVAVVFAWEAAVRVAGRSLRPAAAQLEKILAVGAIILAVGVTFGWLNNFPLNHDTSWYLVATRKWMNGAVLYRDIIEVNPPLAFYLTLPGLWIANLAGVGDKTGLLLFLCSLISVSLLIVQRMLSAATITPLQRRGMLAAAGVALLILPLEVFAQREHIMVVMMLPYLFGKMLLPMGLRASNARDVGLGLFAILGLCLKPHFLALPLCLTLLEVWRSRSIRSLITPDNLTIGVGAFAYLTLIVLWHPTYLDRIVPMAMLVYGAYGLPAVQVVVNSALISMLLTLTVWRCTATSGNEETSTRVLIAASFAFVLSYFVQFTGYRYQSLPIEVTSLLAVAWILTSNYSTVRRSPVPAIAAVIVLWLTIGTSMVAGHYPSGHLASMKAAMPGDVAGRRVMAFSGSVALTFPFVLETGAVWTSRYAAQWLIPGAVSKLAATDCVSSPKRCQALRDVLTFARDTAVEDFVTQRPDIVLLDNRPLKTYFDGVEFDYIEFMSADQEFAAAWAEYTHYGDVLFFAIFYRESGRR